MDYALISKDTPLISNLNMLENIALIKEVHELLSRDEAEKIADTYLAKIGLSNIGLKRLNQCSPSEVFYVMFIRALMSKEKSIIILTPLALMSNLSNMQTVIDTLHLLETEKEIFIFDTLTNKSHYEGNPCLIVK